MYRNDHDGYLLPEFDNYGTKGGCENQLAPYFSMQEFWGAVENHSRHYGHDPDNVFYCPADTRMTLNPSDYGRNSDMGENPGGVEHQTTQTDRFPKPQHESGFRGRKWEWFQLQRVSSRHD